MQVQAPLGVVSHETDRCKNCPTNQPTSLGTQSQGCPRKFPLENLDYFHFMQILLFNLLAAQNKLAHTRLLIIKVKEIDPGFVIH